MIRLQEAIKFFPLRDEDAEDLLSKYTTAVLTEQDYSCDQALREEIAQSLDTTALSASLLTRGIDFGRTQRTRTLCASGMQRIR